jgi:DNA-binding HxlR family transcriptional regulator
MRWNMNSIEIREACQIMKEIMAPLEKERRVTILRSLPSGEEKTFEELQTATGISRGSLHEHLNVLMDIGYIHKTDGRPARYYRDEYLDKLIQIAMEWRAKKICEISKRLSEYQGDVAEQAETG